MKFKVTLTDPANNVFQIKEFSGMQESLLSLERHPEFHTVQEFFNGSVHAFGKNISIDGGREWLKNVQNIFGADAIITILIEVDYKFTGTFETLYNGILAVGLFIETLENDHLLELIISQSLYWQKFIRRFDSKVNLQSRGNLDGGAVVPMNFKPIILTSQKINKSYIAYRSKNVAIPVNDISNPILLFSFDKEELKELEYQSSITPSVIAGGSGGTYPEQDKLIPYFNLIEEGDLVVENILLTMSFGDFLDDPNFAHNVDFTMARNGKCAAMAGSFKLFLQKNEDAPVEFSAVDRSIPNNYLRNDGVTEQLLVSGGFSPKVTDFSFPLGYKLNITKFDSVKLYGKYTGFFPPFSLGKSMIFIWGTEGWDHNSGFEQMIYCMGSHEKWRAGRGDIHDESNQGNFSYGGIYNASTNVFPTTIDNDGGIGQAIKASQWWNISDDAPGILGGVPVNSAHIIQAKVNNPGNTLADWTISTKTPFEGLENYASSLASKFQGYHDASTNLFPTTEKDGVSPIAFKDRWYISSLGNLGGDQVDSTFIIQSLVDVPGATRANWWISTREFYDQYILNDLPFQGYWDASVNLYPALRTDASAIKMGDIWIISTGGTFGGVGGVNANVGQVIRALTNAPGQINANWQVYTLEQWQVYVKENSPIYSGIKLRFETTFPDSVAQGFLIHDVGTAIVDRIAGLPNLFSSPLLGNQYTYKSFGGVGDFSLFALFKGLQIRGFDLVQKPYFLSMKEYWNGLNNVACLALGKYKIAGNDTIVIKKRSEAYDPTMIVKLNWVQNIKKRYKDDQQYTSIEFGYTKWESKSGSNGSGIASGIDDAQTEQTRNTLFKNIGKKLSILSDLVAASLTTEATRRISNKQSANYEYDNNDFIIAVTSNGDGTFKPELDENFSEIDGLLNSKTRYNTRLSTFRVFLRHLDYLSGCLQDNLASFFRFGSGKGNYDMSTKASSNYLGDNPGILFKENQDITPSVNPMFLDQIFDIEHYLDSTCYNLLRDNPDMAIGVSQTDEGHIPFFIDDLKFNFHKGTITMVAKPKSKFDIKTIIAPSGNKRYYEPAYEPEYE